MNRMLLILILVLFLPARSAQSTEFQADVPLELREQVVLDLKRLDSLEYSRVTPFFERLFFWNQSNASRSHNEATSLLNWFEERIRTIGMVHDRHVSETVTHLVDIREPSVMRIAPLYFADERPQIVRIGLLLHEARHSEAEGSHYPHASCPSPFVDSEGKDVRGLWSGLKMERRGACDSRWDGSYGLTAIFLANVSLYCANCSDEDRSQAKIYAEHFAQRVVGFAPRTALWNDLQLDEHGRLP